MCNRCGRQNQPHNLGFDSSQCTQAKLPLMPNQSACIENTHGNGCMGWGMACSTILFVVQAIWLIWFIATLLLNIWDIFQCSPHYITIPIQSYTLHLIIVFKCWFFLFIFLCVYFVCSLSTLITFIVVCCQSKLLLASS